MAISVKQFTNPLNCDEPAYQLDVQYSSDTANGGSIICNGNGTDVSIFGDYANLGDIYTNGSSGSASNTDICLDGIDVVFALDYTSSMAGSIDGAKAGISNIINAIDTASGGNYRIGIVIYDEYNGVDGVTFNYASSTYYTDFIPDSQKFINEDTNSGHTQTFTCMEKMDQVGNSTSAQAALNVLNHAGGNSSTGMTLGSGAGIPEPGGQCIYKIAQDHFAGTWRAGVMRMVINVTDDNPGGYDDSYGGADEAFFQNTIEPFFEAHQILYYHNTGNLTSEKALNDLQTYKYLADNTLPVGLYASGTSYDNEGLWTMNLIANINELCADTVTYTCDPAPAGWYADTPIVAGSTVVYYWDGSAWTNTYTCPDPQYTVTVDIIDSLGVTGSVNNIASNHPNYLDADTFTFTGIQGSQHTATIGTTEATDYENLEVTVSNISDSTVITSATVNNFTDEVTIQVTIGASSSSESIQLNGRADQVVYTMRLDVINSISDTTNALGASQSPEGEMNPTPETPASGWTDVGSTYLNYAQRYEFTGVVGSSHTFDVNFTPVPSDYSVSASLSTALYHNLSGVGGTQYAPMYNAFNGNYTVSASEVTGTVPMPSGGGWAKLFIGGQSNQPSYRFILNSSEGITGASMASGDTQQTFDGYTGDTFNFESLVAADAGYNNVSVSSVILNSLLIYSGNTSITTGPTVNGSNTGAVGVITMPAGGGQGGIILSGSASQISYDFVVTIVDDLSTASWGQVTISGFAGSSHSGNATFLSNADYTYNLTSITDDSSDLSSSIVDATNGIIGLSLPSMPLGGGSATVTVSGEEAGKIFTFELTISTDSPVAGSFDTGIVLIQGVVGSINPGTFTFTQANDHTYSATGTTVSNATHITQAQLQSGSLFNTDYSVTMPSGGGTGTITVDGATSTQTVHTAIVTYDPSFMSDNGSNHSPTFNVGTPSNNGVYDQTIITGLTGDTIPFTMTLIPSPSYYVINISDENPITSSNGASGWQIGPPVLNDPAGSGFFGPLQWDNATDVLSGNLIMPQGGGSCLLRSPKGTVLNPSFDFTVTAYESIPNATIWFDDKQIINNVKFTGNVGDLFSHTFDVIPDAGYTVDVTSVTIGNSYSGALTAAPTASEDVEVNLTMPLNGGSTTVTALGTTTPITYTATIYFTNNSRSTTHGDWDSSILQFTGIAGSQHPIDNTWRLANPSQQVIDTYALSYPTTHLSGISGGNATYGDIEDIFQATFTMPVGGITITIESNTSTPANRPTFACEDVTISILSGSVNSALSYASSLNGATIASFSPSTYQLGSNTYTFTIDVPGSGYYNSGGQITCDVIGTGTTTLPAFTCTDFNSLFSNTGQTVGQSIQFTWDGGPAPMFISPYAFNPPTYQLGSNSYVMDFAVPGGYSNEGANFTCSFTAVGTQPTFTCENTAISIVNGAVNDPVFAQIVGKATNYSIQSVTPSTYQLGSYFYSVGVRVNDSSYSNYGNTIICSVQATGTTTLAVFDCTDANFVLVDGEAGADVCRQINNNDPNNICYGSVSAGTIEAITPTTYQPGTATYTATVLVPSGYSNAGQSIQCTTTAFGAPIFVCEEARYVQSNGTVGDNTLPGATSDLGTVTSVSPSQYVSGTSTYTATITIPSGYSNAGQSIQCITTADGDPCTAAIQQGAQNGTWTVVKQDNSMSGYLNGQQSGSGQLTFSYSSGQNAQGFSNGTNDLSFKFFGGIPQANALQANYAGNYTWVLNNMHAGIYTIEVTNSDGCTGIYTDVSVTASAMPGFDCETAVNNSLLPNVLSGGQAGDSNQEGTPIQITNANGLTNIVFSPSTYQGFNGNSWQNTYQITFDLPSGYQPGVFTNSPGFFQVVSGVGRVTCQRQYYTAPPATTSNNLSDPTERETDPTTTTTTTSSGGGGGNELTEKQEDPTAPGPGFSEEQN